MGWAGGKSARPADRLQQRRGPRCAVCPFVRFALLTSPKVTLKKRRSARRSLLSPIMMPPAPTTKVTSPTARSVQVGGWYRRLLIDIAPLLRPAALQRGGARRGGAAYRTDFDDGAPRKET